MTFRLLLMMSLIISSVNLIGCDDDDDDKPTAGEAAGEEAGEPAGEEAGEPAGEEAGEPAGEEAGEEGGAEPADKTIVEIASENEDFETLVAAVGAAGLVETLSGEGPFTVLAPNDDAFDAVPADVLADLLADAEAGGSLLADILGMHVVSGAAVMSGDLTDGMTVTTLNGDLTVGIADGAVTFSNEAVTATVVAADIVASNGVIHVIDAVITGPADEPEPEPELGTIVDVAVENGDFEMLVAAVTAAGFVETLSGEGPFTVLAPNDDAFDGVPADVLADLLADAEAGGSLLADILGMHVVADAAVMSGDLTDGMTVTTLNGDLTVGVADGTVTFSNEAVTATVIAADVMASNGVIHVIDTVITGAAEEPTPGTIVEVASTADGFESLVSAVVAAGLADTLNGAGPFTVLAPNDDAFGDVPADVLADLFADAEAGGSLLADILGMHVIAGEAVMSDMLVDGATVATLNGDLTVGIADGTVTFSNGAVTTTVIVADVLASNGVIHVIDTVITAP